MKAFALGAALMLALTGGAIAAQSNDSTPATDTGASQPQQPPARAGAMRFAALQKACGSDFKALCPGMTPGDGKLGPCIRTQRTKLSSGCSDALGALRAGRQGPRPSPQ